MLGGRGTYHTTDFAWTPKDAAFKRKGRKEGNFPKDPDTNASLVVEERMLPGLEAEAVQLLRDFADGVQVAALIERSAAATTTADGVPAGLREAAAAAAALCCLTSMIKFACAMLTNSKPKFALSAAGMHSCRTSQSATCKYVYYT